MVSVIHGSTSCALLLKPVCCTSDIDIGLPWSTLDSIFLPAPCVHDDEMGYVSVVSPSIYFAFYKILKASSRICSNLFIPLNELLTGLVFAVLFISAFMVKVVLPIWILQPGSIQIFLFGIWVRSPPDLYISSRIKLDDLLALL